jgi:hypothetical protein
LFDGSHARPEVVLSLMLAYQVDQKASATNRLRR